MGTRSPVWWNEDQDRLEYKRQTGGFGLVPTPVFGASGDDHAVGLVPDPGSTSGSTRFLREDRTWAVPSGGGGGGAVSDGDYGDVVVSSSGTAWTLDPGVVTTFARTFLDDVNAAAVRTTLGLAIGTDVMAQDAGLVSLATVDTAADLLPYTTAANTWASTAISSTGRTLVGGANAAAMRSTLGLVIGTDVMAQDAGLVSLASVDTAADLLPYTTAANTWASTAISSTGRTLVGGANAAAMRSTLGLVLGTNVQAWDADLDALAALGATAGMLSRTGAAAFAPRTLQQPSAGLTIANPTGAAGDPTFALADDLAALEGLGTTGYAQRTGTSAWTTVTALQILDDVLTTKGDSLGFSTVPARVPVGGDGAVWIGDSSTALGVAYLDVVDPIFGDGSDGNVTYAANTTLAEPLQANNVTINTGVRLNADGYIVRGKGTLTFTDASSIISNNGTAATGSTGGAGANTTRQLGGGGAGAAAPGTTGVGNAGTARANSWGAMVGAANASDGGGGGNSGSPRVGGAGGNSTEPPSANNRSIGAATYSDGITSGASATLLHGGSGGGSGASDGTGAGGGGGGGAGVTIVAANKVAGNGTVQANGGAGANGAGTAAGGGGGGGGGSAVLVAHYLGAAAPTVTATGGANGTGTTTGQAGSAGQAGVTETRII